MAVSESSFSAPARSCASNQHGFGDVVSKTCWAHTNTEVIYENGVFKRAEQE